MDNNRGVKIYLDQGVVSSVRDEVRWNLEDRHISTLVLKKRSYEEVTYSYLVDRISRKIKIDVAATKIQLSYFLLVMDHI